MVINTLKVGLYTKGCKLVDTLSILCNVLSSIQGSTVHQSIMVSIITENMELMKHMVALDPLHESHIAANMAESMKVLFTPQVGHSQNALHHLRRVGGLGLNLRGDRLQPRPLHGPRAKQLSQANISRRAVRTTIASVWELTKKFSRSSTKEGALVCAMETMRENKSQGYHAVQLGEVALDLIGPAAEAAGQLDMSAPALVTCDDIFGN